MTSAGFAYSSNFTFNVPAFTTLDSLPYDISVDQDPTDESSFTVSNWLERGS